MKEKLKVYHGLPKTPITDDTVFYTDFSDVIGERTPSITGYGVKSNKTVSLTAPTKVTTVDFWVKGKLIEGTDTTFFLLKSGDNHINFRSRADNTFHTDVYIKSLNTTYFAWVRLSDIKQDDNFNHVRLVFDVEHNTIKYCINGVFYDIRFDSTIYGEAKRVLYSIDTIKFETGKYFSDFHLSSTVNYDYFPTLPQDFIDGKAIVVPALNQRQSYGDPVLHQVTELLVPYATSENNPYSNVPVDGLYTHKTKPELSVNGADLWGTNSKIRITGLNNSIITGVIDTDTAVARIVKSSSAPNTKLYLDSVVGLSVGDTVRIAEVAETSIYPNDVDVVTIQSIDVNEKSIGITSTNWSVVAGRHYIFETTPSSSTPVVKTVDGAIVNGTWSGLGTRVATFTFGDNSNIVGKDLVVTYCLNAIGNSSPYPKMPSEVIRGYDELGNELVPVSIPVFKDDFRGKVKGNLDVCPHYASFLASPTLTRPTSFTPDSYIHYERLYSQDDYLHILSNNHTTNVSQACFSFDVLSLLKHKLGKDDLTIQQAINLIESINFSVYGYGYGNNVHALNTTVYVVDTNEWSGNVETHNESKVTHLLKSTGAIARVIDSKGFTHFLVYTNACGSYESTLVIDYVNIELVLKTEERFTYLALDEEDIDRSKKCNPILVDMQTKEVKRLLPSKAPFSTEVIVHNPTRNSQLSDEEITLYQNPQGFVTTQGSGSSAPMTEALRGLIGKLGISSYQYTNENLVKLPVTGFSQSYARNMFVQRQFYPTQLGCHEPKELGNVLNSVFICCDIINLKGTLYLKVIGYALNDVNKAIASIKYYYTLPNRPLIK